MIVDQLTKQGIFILTTIHCTSEDLAILFVLHVFSKDGVPKHVTSDHGPEFVSCFFCSLGKALDMNLHFTSGYHPKGDSQTEWTDQTLEQYLHIFCNYQQDNWYMLSATTGISPFFANKGYHPNLTTQNYHFQSSALLPRLCQCPSDACSGLYCWTTSICQSKVLLHDLAIQKKLSEKFLGPFEILAKAGTHSYTLWLLDAICGVHPIFHVSMLEPATPNKILNYVQFSPPPVEVQGELEYEISEVLDSKIDNERSCKLLYLVQWLGYKNTNNEFSWIPAMELDHAKDLIFNFHSAYPHKPGLLACM